MSNKLEPGGFVRGGLSRRKFLTQASATAAGFCIVPRRALGGAGYVSPSDKINIAFIGVGAQGLRVMLRFLREPDVQGVAVCDVNKSGDNYPQWDTHEFCKSVRELLGVDSGWDWLSPDKPIQLTHSLRVTGGVAGREPCQKIVNAYYGGQNRSGSYQGCAAYADFRELLEKQKDLDAVVVCTTDNLHAAVSAAAMKKHKHVFCQKPLTHTIYEARRIAEIARETGVATQIAVANQASEDTRVLCEWIWDGAIGPVREVHNWSSRPFWPLGIPRPAAAEPVPDGLDWDMWLGPAPERPYHSTYLPFSWRAWYDFGCGSFGDMGCYSFAGMFKTLGLTSPLWAEATSTENFEESYPKASLVHMQFPASGSRGPVRLSWYDGGLMPARPEGILAEDEKLFRKNGEGVMYVGDKGFLLGGFNGDHPRVYPRTSAYEAPAADPHQFDEMHDAGVLQWVAACKGGPAPLASFETQAPVTEALLMGCLTQRLPWQRFAWDAAGRRITNSEAANRFVDPPYRGAYS